MFVENKNGVGRSWRQIRETGPNVTSVKKGDHVIPLYTPECRQCEYCLSGRTNLCQAIRETQGQGIMPNGTSRFSLNGEKVYHYMGCSTFSNFTVIPEIALAKIREDAPFDKVCYIGCGVTTGIGAVVNTAKVRAGDNVIIFGLGGIGLNVVQGAKLVGANIIVGIDLNNDRRKLGEKFGLGAYKGVKVSFRSWNGQLRQPILLAAPRSMVSVSPQEGYIHPVSELDTMGKDQPESTCKF